MEKFLKIGLIGLSLLFFSCDKNKGINTLKIGEVFEMELDKAIENSEYGISLRVENIYDSRCPIGLDCVWVGSASVEFQLITKNGKYNFTLETHSNFTNDTVIDGFKFLLRNVLPYPVFGEEEAKQTVRILVDKNESIYDEYYNAIVVRKGLDCGNSFLIQFDHDAIGLPSQDKVYYEINLPEKYKINNERVSVKFRVPTNEELMVCTTMGYAFPQLYIVDVR